MGNHNSRFSTSNLPPTHLLSQLSVPFLSCFRISRLQFPSMVNLPFSPIKSYLPNKIWLDYPTFYNWVFLFSHRALDPVITGKLVTTIELQFCHNKCTSDGRNQLGSNLTIWSSLNASVHRSRKLFFHHFHYFLLSLANIPIHHIQALDCHSSAHDLIWYLNFVVLLNTNAIFPSSHPSFFEVLGI